MKHILYVKHAWIPENRGIEVYHPKDCHYPRWYCALGGNLEAWFRHQDDPDLSSGVEILKAGESYEVVLTDDYSSVVSWRRWR